MFETLPKSPLAPAVEVDDDPIDLPYDDGVPMDSPWHFKQIGLLMNVLETAWKGRRFYCGGNMFLHHSKERARNKDYLGPDFYVVLNVAHDRKRLYWCSWQEGGKQPDFILELQSPSTAKKDRTVKKDIYEKEVKVGEYFLYDPKKKELVGWRLGASGFVAMEGRKGRFWSDKLKLELGKWKGKWCGEKGTWLRFSDADGRMLPTGEESQEIEAKAAKDAERAAKADAESEKARADALAEELRILKARLSR